MDPKDETPQHDQSALDELEARVAGINSRLGNVIRTTALDRKRQSWPMVTVPFDVSATPAQPPKSPGEELLRASQSPSLSPDQLLRSADSTTDSAPRELLRSVGNEAPDTAEALLPPAHDSRITTDQSNNS